MNEIDWIGKLANEAILTLSAKSHEKKRKDDWPKQVGNEDRSVRVDGGAQTGNPRGMELQEEEQ
jgi:hypothetical protein